MQRNITIDIFRMVASFGVVILHVPSSDEYLNHLFWPFCVPFFYITSLFFSLKKYREENFIDILHKMRKRIVIPYLLWSIIYIVLLVMKSTFLGGRFELNISRSILFGESAVHLYFIPTLIIIHLSMLCIWSILNKGFLPLRLQITLIFFVFSYILGSVIFHSFGIKNIGGVISIFLYILVAFLFTKNERIVKRNILASFCGIWMMIFVIIAVFKGYRFELLGNPLILILGGSGFVLFVFSLPKFNLPSTNFGNSILSTSFGVYLCHIIYIEVYEFIQERLHGYVIGQVWYMQFLEAIVIFVTSIFTIIIIRKIGSLSSFFLGE